MIGKLVRINFDFLCIDRNSLGLIVDEKRSPGRMKIYSVMFYSGLYYLVDHEFEVIQ